MRPACSEHAQQHAKQHRDDQCRADQYQRGRQALEDQRRDRLAEAKRKSEIEPQRMPDVMQQLPHDTMVESVSLAKLGHVLRRDVAAFARDDIDEIAWHQLEQHEVEHRGAEQDQHQLNEAAPDLLPVSARCQLQHGDYALSNQTCAKLAREWLAVSVTLRRFLAHTPNQRNSNRLMSDRSR